MYPLRPQPISAVDLSRSSKGATDVINDFKAYFNGPSAAILQGGSNMTGTDLYVNKPHCAAAVRP